MMPPPNADPGLPVLSRRFAVFAGRECRGSSPLYEHLALAIAADDEMLALAALCPPGQPAPNLLLGAVHALLLAAPGDPLARYYPDLCAAPAYVADVYPAFRVFCRARRDAIIEIITSRRVQTNEVRRCGYLYPAFGVIAVQAGGRPLALVEVGASAGLNLLWDSYGYRYQYGAETIAAGDAASPVQIDCDVRGVRMPPLPPIMPRVASRVGIDLNVLDLRDEADARWLRALIWPEHADRARMLAAARPLLARTPPVLLSGDALALLPGLLDAVPDDAMPVVFHTHTLNQFAPGARAQLDAIIERAAARRGLWRLGNDMGGAGGDYFALKLIEYHQSMRRERVLAHVDGHGRWLEWLDEQGTADEQ